MEIVAIRYQRRTPLRSDALITRRDRSQKQSDFLDCSVVTRLQFLIKYKMDGKKLKLSI